MEKEVDVKGHHILIRPIMEEDVHAVSELEAKAFSMPWSEASFQEMVTRKDSLYLVAVEAGQVIGCTGVTNICGDGDVNNVVVREELRGLGIGYELVHTMMLWGIDIGIVNYTLEVRTSNEPALKLYSALGYVIEGRRKNFYEKPREDGYIMWKRTAEETEVPTAT